MMNCHFYNFKNHCILHRYVCVMRYSLVTKVAVFRVCFDRPFVLFIVFIGTIDSAKDFPNFTLGTTIVKGLSNQVPEIRCACA